LQIERVRWRASLAGCQAVVHQHLDGTLSLTHGPHLLGRYTAEAAAQSATKMPARRAVEKPRLLLVNYETGHITCYENRTF
jgi:hypothetical protein